MEEEMKKINILIRILKWIWSNIFKKITKNSPKYIWIPFFISIFIILCVIICFYMGFLTLSFSSPNIEFEEQPFFNLESEGKDWVIGRNYNYELTIPQFKYHEKLFTIFFIKPFNKEGVNVPLVNKPEKITNPNNNAVTFKGVIETKNCDSASYKICVIIKDKSNKKQPFDYCHTSEINIIE